MVVGVLRSETGESLTRQLTGFCTWLDEGGDEGEDSWMTALGEWLEVTEMGNRRSGMGLGRVQNTEF